MWVVDLSHDTGYGKPTELGDSGGPVWIQYEYNYLVGLTSGIAGTQSTLVYPMFDFVKKTNDQFSFRTSP